MAKFIENKYTNNLVELMQANDIKLAFVNKKDDDSFEAVHVWVKCREYFNEFLVKNHHPEFKLCMVHGFDYKHDEYPYDLSATRLALRFPNKSSKETFLKNLGWLHTIERNNNLELTVTYEVEDAPHKNMLILEADKAWVQKCLLTNLYTLAIKMASLNVGFQSIDDLTNSYNNSGRGIPSELGYITRVTARGISNLLNNVHTIIKTDGYVDGTHKLRNAVNIHGNSGVVHVTAYGNARNEFHNSFMETISNIMMQNTFNYFKGLLCPVDANPATAS